jgi:hypothetical protein
MTIGISTTCGIHKVLFRFYNAGYKWLFDNSALDISDIEGK